MIIFTEVNKNCRHTLGKGKGKENIINLVINYRNFIVHDDYYDYCGEYKKFKDYYINYTYFLNNLTSITYLNYLGKDHREDGPAWIEYDKNGRIKYKQYYLNDKEYSYEDYLLEIKKLV